MAISVGPPQPREGEGFLLLLVVDVKGVVELAELVMDERCAW
jgi:hypothetical protein